MKPKLLYVGHPALGENLVSTPSMDYLSRTYDIVLLLMSGLVPVFEKYPFFSRIIECNEYKPTKEKMIGNFRLPEEVEKAITELLPPGSKYTAEHDHYLQFTEGYPLFSKYEKLRKVTHFKHYTVMVDILISFGMPKEDIDIFGGKFDSNIRTFYKKNKQFSKTIVIYQGSEERTRRLSRDTIVSITEKVKVNFPHLDIVVLNYGGIRKKISNIKCIMLPKRGQGTGKSLQSIINLFKTHPLLMISPDSGLAHLAMAYNIPQIWLKSRIKYKERVHKDMQHLCTKFKHSKPNCDKACRGNQVDIRYNHRQYLTCCKNGNVPCLNYDESNLNALIEVIRQKIQVA